MPKKSIYVSDELAERLAEFEGENWSKVAVLCFEQRLAELMKKRNEGDMQAAIQRLRADKMKMQSETHKEGFAAGFNWAKSDAAYDELERLVSYEHIDQLFETGPSDAFSAGEHLASIIAGDESTDRQTADRFWANLDANGKQYVDEFVEGFIEGANDFFEKVADQL